MKVLIAIGASTLLVSACGQRAEDEGDRSATSRVAAGATAAAAAAPLGRAVSGARAKQIMHVRHEGMESIGDAFKVVGREIKSDNPNVGAIRTAAASIDRLAQQSGGWFPPGTGPNVGKTRAKAEIWQKPRDFAAKDKAFQLAAREFNAAAVSGDIDEIRGEATDLDKACKACHDAYRAPKH